MTMRLQISRESSGYWPVRNNRHISYAFVNAGCQGLLLLRERLGIMMTEPAR